MHGVAKVAERVGFEPTCPAIHRTTRFRVEPGTATSVPLHNGNPSLPQCGVKNQRRILTEAKKNSKRQGLKNTLRQFCASAGLEEPVQNIGTLLLHKARVNLYPMIETIDTG